MRPTTSKHRPLDERIATLQLPRRGTALSSAEAAELCALVAYRGLGLVSPNPLVGCVILDPNGGFLAAGAHELYGGPHAERHAIAELSKLGLSPEDVSGCQVYVSLEPCSHFGKTPPCASALLSLRPKTLVYGWQDPNPLVSGKGLKELSQHGISLNQDRFLAEESKLSLAGFLSIHQRGRLHVGLKAALSQDGAIAIKGDRRAFITGPRARAYGHFLRLLYDGILIGTETFICDTPELSPRNSLVRTRAMPWKIVLDPRARALGSLPQGALEEIPLFKAAPEKVLWLTAPGAASKDQILRLQSMGAKLNELPLHNERFRAIDIITLLKSMGLQSLLIEGGANTYQSFIDEKLVDLWHLFVAPQHLGSKDAIKFPPAGKMLNLDYRNKEPLALGPDLLWEHWTEALA